MKSEMLFLLAVHLVLCAVAQARIWNARKEKESRIFYIIWSVIAVVFPLAGPLMAMAFVKLPAPDNDL